MLRMQLPARLMKSISSLPSSSPAASPTTAATLEEIAANRKGLAKVVLKKGKTQIFRDGSPMVYSGAVDRIIGRPPPKTGDIVLVADGSEKPIGWGLYNSVSMFCVRLMQLEEDATRDPFCALNMEKLLETRFDAAVNLRRSMGLPSADTNVYRLVNSEGDRSFTASQTKNSGPSRIPGQGTIPCIGTRPFCHHSSILIGMSWNIPCPSVETRRSGGIFRSMEKPGQSRTTGFKTLSLTLLTYESPVSTVTDIWLSGLIVDVFCDVAVVASSAAWVEKYKQEIEFLVGKICGINHIKWRPSIDLLKEEGLDVSEQRDSGPAPCSGRVKVMENGICYLISLEGQKTGFYADQRDNRHLISSISKDRRVLDVCCYSGGFALNAARGGANDVIGIDSSLPSLELAKENILLNKLDPGKISFLREDATDFMKGAASRNESWDLIILDPPKLAPRRKVLHSASGMYRNLNALAMQITRRGGLLMTCSCSGAMTQSGLFLQILQGAASMAGRKITILRQAGAASDHPIDPAYPEGAYLTNFLLRVL